MGIMEHQKGNCFFGNHKNICKDCTDKCDNYNYKINKCEICGEKSYQNKECEDCKLNNSIDKKDKELLEQCFP